MFRKSALAMAMLGALATGKVAALGLGEIQLESALNQPFVAEVELLSPTPAELGELKVDIASPEAFESAGIERPLFLGKLKFDVTRNVQGKPVVRITSRDAVREPFLDFLLEVSWSKGRLLREYTVLVDPPVTMPASAPIPLAAPRQSSETVYTSDTPASRVTHTAQMPPVSVTPEGYETRRNDTLWQVAQKVRPDTDVSMEQTMQALLRANPEAFYDNNINNLKAGYVLRVPDREEMTSISKAEALRESRAQYAAWRETHGLPATGTVAADQPASASPETAATDGAHLQLVAPDLSESGSAGGSAGQGEKLDLIQRDLMMANEALEAERRRGDELSGRMAVLEEQIRNMQRLIQLKDDELAQLQAQAAGATEGETAEQMAEATESTDAAVSEGDAVDATAQDTPAGEPVASSDFAPEGISMEEPVPGAETVPEAGVAEENMDSGTGSLDAVPAETVEEPAPASEPAMAIEPAPATPETATPPGFVDQLLANPLWLGAGAVVLALLAFFGLRRKRDVETGFQESILQASQARSSAASDSEFTITAGRASGDSNETSLLSEFAVSDMGSLRQGGEADPLAEADVYLAYGRFQQAEDLIRDALESNPGDENLNLKLLEVHVAAKNQTGFDEHAQAILAHLEGSSDPMWEKVAEMGRELNPENPLYHPGGPESVRSGGGQEIESFEEEVNFDTFASQSAEDETIAAKAGDGEEGGLDFDIDLSLDALETGSADQPDSVEFTPPDISLQMDSVEAEALKQDNALDFDLEGFDLEAGEEVAEDEGDGELTDLDEVSTKLDLARAYIDMGDPDGARNILDEVMEEGNEDQKTEARGIMEQIS